MLSPRAAKNKQPRPEVPGEEAAAVKRSDLQQLNVFHDLLRVMNDPLAGAPDIARHVGRLAVLRARITRAFAARFTERAVPRLPEQVAALGNREIERILLALLEDLTVLRAESE